MSTIYDEIEIEDFDFDPEMGMFYYPCPCGDRFQISQVRHLMWSLGIILYLRTLRMNYWMVKRLLLVLVARL